MLVCELMLEEKYICNVKLELLPENLLLMLFCHSSSAAVLQTFETAYGIKLLSVLCCIRVPFFFPIKKVGSYIKTHLIPPKRTSTQKPQTQPTEKTNKPPVTWTQEISSHLRLVWGPRARGVCQCPIMGTLHGVVRGWRAVLHHTVTPPGSSASWGTQAYSLWNKTVNEIVTG